MSECKTDKKQRRKQRERMRENKRKNTATPFPILLPPSPSSLPYLTRLPILRFLLLSSLWNSFSDRSALAIQCRKGFPGHFLGGNQRHSCFGLVLERKPHSLRVLGISRVSYCLFHARGVLSAHENQSVMDSHLVPCFLFGVQPPVAQC